MTMQSSLGSESLNQEKDELELKKLQEENKRWESDVKSFKERETLKVNVKTLEKKKCWLLFKEELSHFKQLKEKANEIGAKYERAEARFEPLKKTIAEKEKTCRNTETAVKTKVLFTIVNKLTVLIFPVTKTLWRNIYHFVYLFTAREIQPNHVTSQPGNLPCRCT